MKKWKTLDSKYILDTPFCQFRIDKCELGDGRIMPKYYVLGFTDWVNIVPVTSENKVILIKQYRHAIGEITWEIPGGASHTDGKESFESEALRELREETGYTSNKIITLPTQHPNPALQNNKLHCFLALECKKTHEISLDPFEEIETYEKKLDEVYEMIMSGQITHSLMISSLLVALNALDKIE